MTLPQEIILRLQRVKLRIKLVWLLKGICRLVIVAFIIAGLAFVIDWTLPDLPRTVRLSFFYFGVLLLVYLSYRHIVRPLSAGINDDDLAVLLEKKYPALQERLISTLQLSREIQTGFNSPELIKYLAGETEAISRQIKFTDIVRFNRAIKPGLVAFAVILISASYTAFYQEYTSIWFNRLLGGNALWPKRVMLVVEVKNAHNNIAARGQDVEIIASAKKGSISKVYLHYESPDTNRTELMLPLQKNVFRFDFQNVRDDFKFYVKGGDDQTDWVSINVLTPPALDKIYLYYEYPSYTKLPPPAQPVEGGSIKAPLGTKVKLVGIANIELKEASIEIMPPVSDTPTINIITYSDGKPTRTQANLTVLTDGSYRINLTALNTLPNTELIQYPIKVIPDTAPVIKVIEPTSEYKYITPLANIPLKVLTTDDYGLKEVSLVYGLAMLEPPDEHKINLYTDISETPTSIESGYNLDIGQLHLKEGDVLKLYFSATDNCEIPKANQTRSVDYYLSVIGQPQMERMLNEIMLRLKEDIRKTRDLQQQEISQTKELAARAEKGSLDASQEQDLSQRVSAQRRVTQQLEQTAKELEQAIKDSQTNKIWEETEKDKISRLLENLKDEITAKSNQATAQLSQATQTTEPKAAQESLKNAAATQQSVADDLKKALDKMQEWEDYQEILRLVRELLERQNKVVEEIKNSSR